MINNKWRNYMIVNEIFKVIRKTRCITSYTSKCAVPTQLKTWQLNCRSWYSFKNCFIEDNKFDYVFSFQ